MQLFQWIVCWRCGHDCSRPSFLLHDAMHKHGICRCAVSVCLSVRLSVTFVDHVKTNKHIFKIFSPSGGHTILVFFLYQTGWRYSDGNSPNGGVKCRWAFWTNIWLRCIQVYSVVNRTSREVWKIKPRWTAASVEHSPRRPSSVVCTRRQRSVCDGLDIICRRRREVKPPGHSPCFLLP